MKNNFRKNSQQQSPRRRREARVLPVGQECKAGLRRYAGVCYENTALHFQSGTAEPAPGRDHRPRPPTATTALGAVRGPSQRPALAVVIPRPELRGLEPRGPSGGTLRGEGSRHPDGYCASVRAPNGEPAPRRAQVPLLQGPQEPPDPTWRWWWQRPPQQHPAAGLEAMEGRGGGRTLVPGEEKQRPLWLEGLRPPPLGLRGWTSTAPQPDQWLGQGSREPAALVWGCPGVWGQDCEARALPNPAAPAPRSPKPHARGGGPSPAPLGHQCNERAGLGLPSSGERPCGLLPRSPAPCVPPAEPGGDPRPRGDPRHLGHAMAPSPRATAAPQPRRSRALPGWVTAGSGCRQRIEPFSPPRRVPWTQVPRAAGRSPQHPAEPGSIRPPAAKERLRALVRVHRHSDTPTSPSAGSH